MKTEYETPKLEIISLNNVNITTASNSNVELPEVPFVGE